MHQISVIIPTIGRESVSRAVESVLAQSLPASEIILVVNGAVEASGAFETDAAVRIRVLWLPPYSGPAISRNVGAWHATGDYVAFLDDDDWFEENYLAEMSERIEACRPAILFGTKVRRDADGTILARQLPSATSAHEWLNALLEGKNPGVGGPNMVVEREAFFGLGGFNVELSSSEDRHLTIAMLSKGYSLELVDDALVNVCAPIGFRSSGRPGNWRYRVVVVLDYWHLMSWRARLLHLYRMVRRYRIVRRVLTVRAQRSSSASRR